MEQTKLLQQIHTVKYDSELHLATINQWLIGWNMKTLAFDELPEHGIILLLNNEPVAAMFVNQGECGMGFIDGFIKDPKYMHSFDLSIYLNKLTLEIIKIAKSLGISKLIGFTVNNSTLLRAMTLGFELQPHKLFILEVK